MTRIKQFANDMGLSYNQAKDLVMQGRKKKDGGSTVLEKFMPIEIVPTKRKKNKMDSTLRQKEKEKQAKQPVKKQSGGGFDDEFRRLQALNREFDRAKQKPEAQKRKESLQRQIKKSTDKGSKSILTRELKAGGKKGINRNLLDDKFLTDEELKKKYPERQPSKQKIKRAFPYAGDRNPGKPTQKPTMTTEEQIRELEKNLGIKKTRPKIGAGTPKMRKSMPRGDITKKMKKGGSNKVLKPIPPDAKGLQALKKERPDVVASMGFKKKGGMLSFDMGGMNDMEDGTYMAKIESLQIVPTKKETMGSPGPRTRPKGGPARPKSSRRMKRGPATGGIPPRKPRSMKEMSMKRPKRMSGGGVARGTGAAVKGTGFKGVY